MARGETVEASAAVPAGDVSRVHRAHPDLRLPPSSLRRPHRLPAGRNHCILGGRCPITVGNILLHPNVCVTGFNVCLMCLVRRHSTSPPCLKPVLQTARPAASPWTALCLCPAVRQSASVRPLDTQTCGAASMWSRTNGHERVLEEEEEEDIQRKKRKNVLTSILTYTRRPTAYESCINKIYDTDIIFLLSFM